MKHRKIIHIVGARPQIIKYAAIHHALTTNPSPHIKHILIHSGQHYDYPMSDLFFLQLKIPQPHHHLQIGSGTHAQHLSALARRLEPLLRKENPALVVVYGDTDTTLGAALIAAQLHIPVAHVEAGVRAHTHILIEELNRVVADRVSTLLFCPTATAVENLKKEGFSNIYNCGALITNHNIPSFTASPEHPAVFNTGDVMYDLFLKVAVPLLPQVKQKVLAHYQLTEKQYCLMTLHRAENVDQPANLQELLHFVDRTAPHKYILFPVHPRTQKQLHCVHLPPSIITIPPTGYIELLALASAAAMVFTDSGGLQKEAYWLRVPCVTLRTVTEWPETLHNGWNTLYVNFNKNHKPTNNHQPTLFGIGQSAEVIVQLVELFALSR